MNPLSILTYLNFTVHPIFKNNLSTTIEKEKNFYPKLKVLV